MERTERPIALVGLMGAGKSAVAAALARRLGGEAVDLDARVEELAGASIAELFAREGEAGFRRRESEALAAALRGSPRVLATGGGLVLDPLNRAVLKERCRIAWLEVSPGEAARRVGSTAAARPVLGEGPVELRLAALLRERAPLYESLAEIRLGTDGRSADQVAEALHRLLSARGAGIP